MSEHHDKLVEHLREAGRLEAIGGLLGWDQETCMPPAGAEQRSEQLALVARLHHERMVSPRLAELLEKVGEEVQGDVGSERHALWREARRDHDKAVKVPASLVAETARTTSLAREAWVEARQTSDFSRFRPWLERVVDLKRQYAEAVGYAEQPYDALLDDYEPGATVSRVAPVLRELEELTVPLVRAIGASSRRPTPGLLKGRFPRQRQEQFLRAVVEDMGFDMKAGRIDVAPHPFCSGSGPRDVRLTTRYDEENLTSALFSAVHEAGHGLYEQGLPAEHAYTPLGKAASLVLHESQSRLWENFLARSLAFWKHYLPRLERLFPGLAGVSLDDFHFAINQVAPSLIRVDADEVTYNLHIVLRFGIETDIFSGRVEVGDLPELWNRRMEELLGIRPGDDASGLLQDIHWSIGGMGYFCTYSLGNLAAARWHEALRSRLGDLDALLARGELRPIREWLCEHVHRHGMRYRTDELLERETGKPLGVNSLARYFREKFGSLYGLI